MHQFSVRKMNFVPLGFVLVLVLVGCQTAYYGAMEKLGYHKRDLLVSDVQKARDAQEEAKEQFQTAFEQFSTVLNFKGGALQDTYEKLNAEYERSESKAQAVHGRIASVDFDVLDGQILLEAVELTAEGVAAHVDVHEA